MKQYTYLGYFNDNADIKDIIENGAWKNPDALEGYLKGGYGKFYSKSSDGEECMTSSDVDGKDILITTDKEYIIKFTEGYAVALDEDDHYSVNAGYFIDVWKAKGKDENIVDLSNDALEAMSENRHKENMAIKAAIKDEFKAAFKKPGTGIDFYTYASSPVYGMLDATGEIGKMYLNRDNEIIVSLIQEYEDAEEDFESRYFACDDWPLLLLLVRKGIRNEWFIDGEEE